MDYLEKNVYQKKLTYKKIRSKYHIKTGNNIESYTKKQLRIPSLEEYLSICKRYHMKPVIEIKQKDEKRYDQAIVSKFKKSKNARIKQSSRANTNNSLLI